MATNPLCVIAPLSVGCFPRWFRSPAGANGIPMPFASSGLVPRRPQIRRRTPRPGVTAAATTAVLATGEGPGETAFATTAVLATGWPITPPRPTRAALRGISFSLGRLVVVGLDRREDRLDRDASVRDELTPGAP